MRCLLDVPHLARPSRPCQGRSPRDWYRVPGVSGNFVFLTITNVSNQVSTRTYAEASVHATIYWVSGGSTHSVYTFTRRSRVQIQQSSVFGGAAASFVRPPPPFFGTMYLICCCCSLLTTTLCYYSMLCNIVYYKQVCCRYTNVQVIIQ